MSLMGENGTQFTMPVVPAGGMSGCGMGGFGGDGWWGILFLLAVMSGGWGGFGGFGGMGGLMSMWPFMFSGFGCNGGNGNAATQADVQRAVDQQTLISKIDQQTYGTANAAYDINNTLRNGFSDAELSRCNQQAQLMQMLCQMSSNQQDCCCRTNSAIERANYDAAIRGGETNRLIERGFCDAIQAGHNDADRILARLDAMERSQDKAKIAEQAAEIQAYKQNAAFGAMLDASRAEILRRTGAECPTPAYVVQPPTPVNFPTNCCGQFSGWGNNGCGGCGNC